MGGRYLTNSLASIRIVRDPMAGDSFNKLDKHASIMSSFQQGLTPLP